MHAENQRAHDWSARTSAAHAPGLMVPEVPKSPLLLNRSCASCRTDPTSSSRQNISLARATDHRIPSPFFRRMRWSERRRASRNQVTSQRLAHSGTALGRSPRRLYPPASVQCLTGQDGSFQSKPDQWMQRYVGAADTTAHVETSMLSPSAFSFETLAA